MFGFSVSILIKRPAELASVLKRNPFLGKRGVDPTELHVTFLSGFPKKAGLTKLKTFDGGADEWALRGKEIYLHCPGGYGGTKLSNNALERTLSVTATTRNWKLVIALVDLAG